MNVYEDIKAGLEEAIAYEKGKTMERLTKREGKHTIRIGNEWRRNDPVWNRLAYCEDLLEALQLPDCLVLAPNDDGVYQLPTLESWNADGTITFSINNKDYKE